MSGRRFAYADPPYLGCAVRYYGHRHPDAALFDRVEAHAELMHRMERDFDGWAISLHAPSLQALLAVAPAGVRVAAWVKPFSGTRPGVRMRSSWEPVIYRTSLRWIDGPQFVDHLVFDAPRSKAGVDRFEGQKPEAFSAWIADLLGHRPGDEIADLFPGSGACGRAFAKLAMRDPEQFRLVEQVA